MFVSVKVEFVLRRLPIGGKIERIGIRGERECVVMSHLFPLSTDFILTYTYEKADYSAQSYV